MQEFWPLGFKSESMVIIFEVNNSAIPSHSGTSFALWAISDESENALQVSYVRPAPIVLRLDPMQITAKTETKISLYMKYLAPVSSVSQVSILILKSHAIPVITRVCILRRPACCLFSL